MRYSLIVSTLGRRDEVLDFIRSIQYQTFKDLEVIIVDQNNEDTLAGLAKAIPSDFSVKYMHCPDIRGLSRGRNAGYNAAIGEIVCFPDDDCTYPPDLLAQVGAVFQNTMADIVCGRAADESGRDINGRYESKSQEVTFENVFTTQIEWVVFFKRKAFQSVGGYDEQIGTGASTPWQANEGQDIILRALVNGLNVWYDPEVYGHHPELDIYTPDTRMRRKAREYGRGMGYVAGKHGYSIPFFAKYIFRSVGGLILYTLKFNLARAAYYANVALGRIEGFLAGRRVFRLQAKTSETIR